MRRRDFITLVGGAAAWPLSAQAQQATPVIGYLSPGQPEVFATYTSAFRRGLGESGFVEGRNVGIEFRWDNGERARLPELAADLVRRSVSVIVTPNGMNSALAAKAATGTIPIVFWSTANPIQAGLISSLNKPGGNVTGVASMGVEIEEKQLSLLRELLPEPGHLAVLVNPEGRFVAEFTVKQVQAAAAALGQRVEIIAARTNRDIADAFERIVQEQAKGLLVTPNALFQVRRWQITILAARHAVPVIYWEREFVENGGLMSYGPSTTDAYRQVGIYTGRILKGEKPADLPVIQPTQFELAINLTAAKAIGLHVPLLMLARADEVIE